MANHVQNYLKIRNCNQLAITMLEEFFQTEEGEFEVHTEELTKRIFKEETPKEYDRGWYCDNVGAKWVNGYLEDVYEDEVVVELTSAWSPVFGLVEKLYDVLSEVCEGVYILNSFQDESYEPTGVQIVSEVLMEEQYLDIEDYDLDWDSEDYDENLDKFYSDLSSMEDNLVADMENCYKE